MIYGPSQFYDKKPTHWTPTDLSTPSLKHVKPPPPRAPAISTLSELPLFAILDAVAWVTGISRIEIASPCRFQRYVAARHVYFYLARKLTSCSNYQIGKRCGGLDHSTVIHGAHKVEHRMAEYAETISAVRKALGVSDA